MKFTLFFCFLFLMQLNAGNAYSQTAHVNLNESSLTLGELMARIEKQTGYLFIYSKKDVDVNKKVRIDASGKAVADILSEVFKGTNISFKFANNYISLYKKGTEEAQTVQ